MKKVEPSGGGQEAEVVAVATQFNSLEPIDVTDKLVQCCCILTCPVTWMAVCPGVLGYKELTLEDEETVLKYNCCGICDADRRMPYGELGNVEVSNVCCFTGLSSNLGPLFPGWGCDKPLVVSFYQFAFAALSVSLSFPYYFQFARLLLFDGCCVSCID